MFQQIQWYLPPRKWVRYIRTATHMVKNIHISIIQKSQRVEESKCPTVQWANTVMYSNNIKQHEKGVNWGYTTTYKSRSTDLKESSQMQKGTNWFDLCEVPKEAKPISGGRGQTGGDGEGPKGEDGHESISWCGERSLLWAGQWFHRHTPMQKFIAMFMLLNKKRSIKSLQVTQKSNIHKTIKDQLIPNFSNSSREQDKYGTLTNSFSVAV